MQTVSATYESILNGEHWAECKVTIVDDLGVTQDVSESELFSVQIKEGALDNHFALGNAISSEINIVMIDPGEEWTPATMGQIRVYVRICNDTQQSEWLPKGVFYIDTREKDRSVGDLNLLKLHGYDAMLMTEQDYPETSWNTKSDYNVVKEICTYLGWTLESGTDTFFQTTRAGYVLPTPYNYSIREVLQSIAAVNCGNFVMDEEGKLKLIRFNALPTETYYLITPAGSYITIGGDRIVLQ